jgi:hypothetical protein
MPLQPISKEYSFKALTQKFTSSDTNGSHFRPKIHLISSIKPTGKIEIYLPIWPFFGYLGDREVWYRQRNHDHALRMRAVSEDRD